LNGTNPPQTPTGNCTGTTTTTTTGNITSQTVQTSVSIISAGTVSSSANVNFKSPDISLNNGFTIDSWGEFYAENVNCNSPLREDYSIPKSEFRLQKSNLEVYPNPVTSFANIHFNIEDDNPVSIFITDITGKEITRIAENERFQKGNNQLNFNAENYPAGVYFITMQSGDQYATNKLIINK